MTLQTSPGAEKSRRKRRGKHARLPAQVSASRVPKEPSGNERQERKDAVSGRKDGNRAAGNTMARQQNWTERRSSVFGGRPQCVLDQRKSCGNHRLANVTTLPTANAGVTRTRWHRQHAIDVATQKVHPGGKTAKVVTVSLSNLGKPGDNGATPALDNIRQGIAHRDDQSVRKVDPNRRDLDKRLHGRVGVHQRHPLKLTSAIEALMIKTL